MMNVVLVAFPTQPMFDNLILYVQNPNWLAMQPYPRSW
jgi:hypothetical protein